ncbi:hypothetical protein, partial [Micromonospora sediminicola]|uniref:hypothetical protein n=1 Tax=Micromonospora sediminicola TaxID=946078 RepID=UPI0033EB6714
MFTVMSAGPPGGGVDGDDVGVGVGVGGGELVGDVVGVVVPVQVTPLRVKVVGVGLLLVQAPLKP